MPPLLFLDLPETETTQATDAPAPARQLHRNDLIDYEGRRYFVLGFDPLSVQAQRVYLEDIETQLPRTAALHHLLESHSLADVTPGQ